LSEDEAEVASSSWLNGKKAHGGVMTSAGVEAAPGREKRGDDSSWTDTNLYRQKNEENPHDQFSYYKWTMKI
jgi:hypothetical protein